MSDESRPFRQRVVEKVIETLIVLLCIGFFAILWRGVGNFDTRLQEVQNGYTTQQKQILNQQEIIVKTQNILAKQLAEIQAKIEEEEEEHKKLLAAVASQRRAISELIGQGTAKIDIPNSPSNTPAPDNVRQEAIQRFEDDIKGKLPVFKK